MPRKGWGLTPSKFEGLGRGLGRAVASVPCYPLVHWWVGWGGAALGIVSENGLLGFSPLGGSKSYS